MSDSMRPHRRQPTTLPRPWDSPGKNTGVGCHFLLQCMKVKSESVVVQLCPTLRDPMDCSLPGLLHPWDSPGESTGVGCHCLLLRRLYRNLNLSSLVAESVKSLPTMRETLVQSLGQEDPLEKEMATLSSIFA